MIYEIISSASIGIAIGYWFGRENTIKHHRRLYNLNTNLNLLYAEHTEKDKVFDEVKKNSTVSPKVFGVS